MRLPLHFAVHALFLLALVPPLFAQQYPVKPIRLVVGFAAGGATDVVARLIGQKLTEKLGQPVVVENRPGAGGNIAAELVAKSASDGYTLLVPAFAHVVNPALYAKLPFDTVKDFAPVTLFASAANILAVHPSVPVRSVKEFIALAKARPGELTYGAGGNGTASHLAGELLNSMAGIKVANIQYKGSAPASVDLLGGHISAAFPGVGIAMPHVRSGRLRALGIASLKRSTMMPEVPTISEAGVPGFEVISWYGLLAPAGTPSDIVQRLNSEVTRSLHEPDAIERLRVVGFDAVTTSPAEFGAFITREIAKWTKVVRAAGVRVE
ncbi:MAG: tripartite tricarboxylate transporter substrate binding protein [Betaproteobacteria bacterium]|nr:tripartite tricarboxylate transporter substrate binding protein [Betaproteobacteria bacterium]